MTTTHDNAHTWRDLTDQLTPDQIEKLAGMEQRSRSSTEETAEALLEGARDWAQKNITDTVTFGHIEAPAGAGFIEHWEDDYDGNWSRRFDGDKWTVGNIDADIVGVQHPDGSVQRSVYVNANGEELTGEQARELAAALTEAADELDRLSR